MKKSVNITSKIAPLLSLLSFLLIWELVVRLKQIPEYILASPSQVFISAKEIFPMLLTHTSVTFLEAVLGFVLSIILAFLLAFVLIHVSWLKQAIYPLLIISQTIPLIILAVLFLIWFGFGILPKVLVTVLVCFFPVVISLINGLDSVDPEQINLFRSMGASQMAIYKMVRLPAAMPSFFSGLRISATYSIMAAVIGEWMGAQSGLGYFMTLAQKSFQIDQVLAAVFIISLLSLLLVKIVDLMEYLLVPWNRESNEHNAAQ
jgi:ABC-type nitrate/sulfonate/bicarbonate transport system permease component